MDSNAIIQKTAQNYMDAYTHYAMVISCVWIMIIAPFAYLFSKAVLILRDLAINSQKTDTGEDYKGAGIAADVMAWISIGLFIAAAIYLIRTVAR